MNRYLKSDLNSQGEFAPSLCTSTQREVGTPWVKHFTPVFSLFLTSVTTSSTQISVIDLCKSLENLTDFSKFTGTFKQGFYR